MRSILLSLAIATCVLAPVNAVLVEAGQDDSGLQVFELNGTNLTGMMPVTIKEDTGIAEDLINLVPSKQGYYSLLDFGALNSGYTDIPRTFVKGTMFDNSGQSLLALEERTAGGTDEIIWYTAGGVLTSEIDANASSYASWFSAFFNTYIYIVNGDSFIRFQPSAPSPSSLSHPWSIASTACVFKNRLWVAESTANTYVYYSSALDWSDFTASATAGGVFNVQSITGVRKLLPTIYGLYMLCENDIFLLSGGDSPTSWRLDKIATGYPLGYKDAYTYYATVVGNDVYFLTKSRSLFRIAGNAVQLVTTMPQKYGSYIADYSSCGQFKNRFIVFTNRPNNYYGIIYDLQENSWFLTTEYSYVVDGSDGYYISVPAANNKFTLKVTPNFAESDNGVYGEPVIYPWQWNSSWLTLTGNSNELKEVNRIEMEYQGGTSSVNIYATNPDGTVTGTATTFYPTTSSFITTGVWMQPFGKRPINKLYLAIVSSGTQTQNVNYMMKKVRVYYRNIGSYGTQRSGK